MTNRLLWLWWCVQLVIASENHLGQLLTADGTVGLLRNEKQPKRTLEAEDVLTRSDSVDLFASQHGHILQTDRTSFGKQLVVTWLRQAQRGITATLLLILRLWLLFGFKDSQKLDLWVGYDENGFDGSLGRRLRDTDAIRSASSTASVVGNGFHGGG